MKEFRELREYPVGCPCGYSMRLVRIAKFGPYYECERAPDCDWRRQCNKRTGVPHDGIPTDRLIRMHRRLAHEAFDQLWKPACGGGLAVIARRGDCYAWLASILKTSHTQAHISRFGVDDCLRTIEAVNSYLRHRASELLFSLDQTESLGRRQGEEGMTAGYEEAPATKMLATKCAVCSRPLVDASSVELGIGPICREGMEPSGVLPGAREEANKIVYKIAAEQTGPAVIEGCLRLDQLGYRALSYRILERIGCVMIEESPTTLIVKGPYVAESIAAWREIPGRRFDREREVNIVPLHMRAEVWNLLRTHYAGLIGIGPKGPFKIAPLPGPSGK